MSESDEPDPPPRPRNPGLTFVLIVVGVLLLLPGLRTLIFFREYVSPPNFVPDSSILQAWILSFVISAGGMALLIYAFRK